MFKIVFALMILVNVAVFLWPAGDKAPFFDSRSDDTLPTIKADKMLLLTETVMTDRLATSSPALAQPSESQISLPTAPKTPTADVTNKPAPANKSEQVAVLPQVDVAVTPITLPSLSNQRPDNDKAAKRPKPSKPEATPETTSETTPASDKTDSAQDAPKKESETKLASNKKAQAPLKPEVTKQRPAKVEPANSKAEKPKDTKIKPEKAKAQKAQPDKPTQKAAVAKVDPAPVAGECVRIGPFSKDDNLQAAASRVTGFGAAFTQRTVPSRDVRTWRVFAGPFASEQETFDKDAVLAISGFTDRYVMNDLNGQKFISLGVFSAEKSATALSERLVDQPMTINIRPEIRQLNPTKWLEVAAPGLKPADKSSLESHAWPTRRVQVKPINCRPASG